MREILFCGKGHPDFNDGAWYEGYLMCIGKYYQIQSCGNSVRMTVIPETVGQYTGCKDKNGIKIFDGDILNFLGDYEDGEEPSKYVVEWDDSWHAFMVKMQADCDIDDAMDHWNPSEWEIIGNVFDNPGLIGAEENG